MGKIKNILFMLIGLGLSGLFTLLLLEILLRFLPVAQPLFSQAVTFDDPVSRFQANRTVTWSNEWNFSIVTKRRINNDGFANDQDYDPDDPRPLAAVIGDSYIEAMMVAYEDTLYGRLSEKVSPDKRVYSFAMSGAPLSQYLIWADYAKKTYAPELLIVNIVSNDFDQSLPRYAAFQNFQQFMEKDDGTMRPVLLQEYHPSPLRNIVGYSALARYLFFNLKASHAYSRMKQKFMQQKNEETHYIANVEAHAEDEKLFDSYKAIAAFLTLLPDYSGLSPEKIILSVDAPRSFIYNPQYKTENKIYFEQTRDYLMNEARDMGYTVVDTLPAFKAHYAEHKERFEFESDWHWNGLGHDVVSEAIFKTDAFQNFLSGGGH